MNRAQANAILQSRGSDRADRTLEVRLLADPEYIAIRARIAALPRDRAERTPLQQAQMRDLLERKYARAEALA